ncbi:MAG: hypothetical protein IH852_07440 [Bacteroidetes bacterium]|nr:hypothetical protein [Bacteroidota bacterium]
MELGRIKMNWKLIKFVFPVLLGAVGGFLYYKFIGCNGSCAITGDPYISTLYGAGIGAVLVNWKSGINSMRKNNNNLEKEGEK